LCAFEYEGQSLFVLQLLAPPPSPPSPPAVEARPDPALAAATGELSIAQKQKLECALQLTRTVALDFNNALTSILGHTSLLLGRMESNHPWHSSLMEVEKSAARAAEIANDLAAFSRQEKEERKQSAGNLNQLLEHVADLFKDAAADKIACSLQLARKLYVARFDEAKMQQAFVKVLENAFQSFGDRPGTVTIQSRNLDLTSATHDQNVQLAAGSYVCVEITDTGRGIEPAILPRIFEPFFTTKKPPHRGLGMAWVYGVVTNHGGGVAVSSQPGAGTSVRVYLPADNRLIQDSSFSKKELNGEQTILMVDDEDLLLTMGKAILSSFGYKVLTANNGRQALEILARKEPRIDLLVTDMVMPGISGRELMEQARKIAPGTPVLCTSGYVFPPKNDEDALFLQKPFTSRDLLLKVKLALAPAETVGG
jgi:two-component system cell cycle sensor histidine kinase/response regulator CckA